MYLINIFIYGYYIIYLIYIYYGEWLVKCEMYKNYMYGYLDKI